MCIRDNHWTVLELLLKRLVLVYFIGQALLQKASVANQGSGNSMGGYSLLQNATNLGLKIQTVSIFIRSSAKYLSKLKPQTKALDKNDATCGMSPILWDNEKENAPTCFIKIEDEEMLYRPLFKQFESFPCISYSGTDSPFDTGVTLNQKNENQLTKKKAVGGALRGGYCESCDHWYKCTLREHLNSAKHRQFIETSENFQSLNKVAHGLPDIKDFVNMVGVKKDCNIVDVEEVNNAPEQLAECADALSTKLSLVSDKAMKSAVKDQDDTMNTRGQINKAGLIESKLASETQRFPLDKSLVVDSAATDQYCGSRHFLPLNLKTEYCGIGINILNSGLSQVSPGRELEKCSEQKQEGLVDKSDRINIIVNGSSQGADVRSDIVRSKSVTSDIENMNSDKENVLNGPRAEKSRSEKTERTVLREISFNDVLSSILNDSDKEESEDEDDNDDVIDEEVDMINKADMTRTDNECVLNSNFSSVGYCAQGTENSSHLRSRNGVIKNSKQLLKVHLKTVSSSEHRNSPLSFTNDKENVCAPYTPVFSESHASSTIPFGWNTTSVTEVRPPVTFSSTASFGDNGVDDIMGLLRSQRSSLGRPESGLSGRVSRSSHTSKSLTICITGQGSSVSALAETDAKARSSSQFHVDDTDNVETVHTTTYNGSVSALEDFTTENITSSFQYVESCEPKPSSFTTVCNETRPDNIFECFENSNHLSSKGKMEFLPRIFSVTNPDYSNITEESQPGSVCNRNDTLLFKDVNKPFTMFGNDAVSESNNLNTPSKEMLQELQDKILNGVANSGSTIRNWLVPNENDENDDSIATHVCENFDKDVKGVNEALEQTNGDAEVIRIETESEKSKVAGWIQRQTFDEALNSEHSLQGFEDVKKVVDTNLGHKASVNDVDNTADRSLFDMFKFDNDGSGCIDLIGAKGRNPGSVLSDENEDLTDWSDNSTSISDCTLDNYRVYTDNENEKNRETSGNRIDHKSFDNVSKDFDSVSTKSGLSSTVTAKGIKISGLASWKSQQSRPSSRSCSVSDSVEIVVKDLEHCAANMTENKSFNDIEKKDITHKNTNRNIEPLESGTRITTVKKLQVKDFGISEQSVPNNKVTQDKQCSAQIYQENSCVQVKNTSNVGNTQVQIQGNGIQGMSQNSIYCDKAPRGQQPVSAPNIRTQSAYLPYQSIQKSQNQLPNQIPASGQGVAQVWYQPTVNLLLSPQNLPNVDFLASPKQQPQTTVKPVGAVYNQNYHQQFIPIHQQSGTVNNGVNTVIFSGNNVLNTSNQNQTSYQPEFLSSTSNFLAQNWQQSPSLGKIPATCDVNKQINSGNTFTAMINDNSKSNDGFSTIRLDDIAENSLSNQSAKKSSLTQHKRNQSGNVSLARSKKKTHSKKSSGVVNQNNTSNTSQSNNQPLKTNGNHGYRDVYMPAASSPLVLKCQSATPHSVQLGGSVPIYMQPSTRMPASTPLYEQARQGSVNTASQSGISHCNTMNQSSHVNSNRQNVNPFGPVVSQNCTSIMHVNKPNHIGSHIRQNVNPYHQSVSPYSSITNQQNGSVISHGQMVNQESVNQYSQSGSVISHGRMVNQESVNQNSERVSQQSSSISAQSQHMNNSAYKNNMYQHQGIARSMSHPTGYSPYSGFHGYQNATMVSPVGPWVSPSNAYQYHQNLQHMNNYVLQQQQQQQVTMHQVQDNAYNAVQAGNMKMKFHKIAPKPCTVTDQQNLTQYWNVKKAGDCRLVFKMNGVSKRKAEEETPLKESYEMKPPNDVDYESGKPYAKRRRCLVY